MSICRQIIMTKWSTISGRFSEEEVALIKKWQKKVRFTDNQLVRIGVEMMIGFTAMSEFFSSRDFAPLQSFVKDIQKSLQTPAVKKELEKAGEKLVSKFKEDQIKQIEKKANELTEELKVFGKHEKRGRKPTKKKRKTTS